MFTFRLTAVVASSALLMSALLARKRS
ncbi:hypothetical protein I0P70_01980 [Pontibacter sp. FD36]|nr:hypothetical protein [Pontibacter sp. FD36]